MATQLTPAIIREELGMKPHPEGGWCAENFKDSHSTAIYYLLEKGEISRWHRITNAPEHWHWYGGSALELKLSDGNSSQKHLLGVDLINSQRPQVLVPTGWWQTAKSLGDWTFVGCTAAPGFDFANFEKAGPELSQQLNK